MRTLTDMLIASALVVLFLVLPADLAAKERRGANLVVTRLDGSQVRGELIAVKPDSLLLLSDLGRDESIDLANIKSIRIVRKSRAGKGAFIGSMGGVLTGVVLGAASGGIDEFTSGGAAVWLGITLGVVGGLGGLVVGSMAGVDSSFTVAGKAETVVAAYWDKLRAHARVPRLPGRSPSAR